MNHQKKWWNVLEVHTPHPTRAAVLEMLWPSRLAITIWPWSNSLKSLPLPIFPSYNTSTLRTTCSLAVKYSPPTNRCHDEEKISVTPFACQWSQCYAYLVYTHLLYSRSFFEFLSIEYFYSYWLLCRFRFDLQDVIMLKCMMLCYRLNRPIVDSQWCEK